METDNCFVNGGVEKHQIDFTAKVITLEGREVVLLLTTNEI